MIDTKYFCLLVLFAGRTIAEGTKVGVESVSLNDEAALEYNEGKCVEASKDLKHIYYSTYFGEAPSKEDQKETNKRFKEYCIGYENRPFQEALIFIRAIGWLYGSKTIGDGKPCYDYFLELKEKMRLREDGSEERFNEDEKSKIYENCFEPIKIKKGWYREIVFAIENFL